MTEISPELRSNLERFIKSQQLSLCAFDMLLTEDSRLYLVDITPNGSWDYFEDDEAPAISEALAKVVAMKAVAQ
jgi:hypothetical protein